MKHIKLFETFFPIEKEKSVNQDKANKGVIRLYKDDNLEVLVVKTLDASKLIGKDTSWCSNRAEGFYHHNFTANMYRFIFKDGYKLRLTWDYIDVGAVSDKYSGGTHWGQGGTIGNKSYPYIFIRPRDNDKPFDFDYRKNDEKMMMVNRISKIPQKARDIVTEYQNRHSREKSALHTNLHREIEKIKIVNVSYRDSKNDSPDRKKYNVIIEYLGKKYNGVMRIGLDYEGTLKYTIWFDNFKLKSNYYDDQLIQKYLIDKTFEWCKKNNYKDIFDWINEIKLRLARIRTITEE